MLFAVLLLHVFLVFTVSQSHAYGGHKWQKMLKQQVDETNTSNDKLNCWKGEEFVSCGPERECEISCYNRINPPQCAVHRRTGCDFPRCLCKKGFVRDDQRNCIPVEQCPKYRKHKAILFAKSNF